jgi:hypothetical protein
MSWSLHAFCQTYRIHITDTKTYELIYPSPNMVQLDEAVRGTSHFDPLKSFDVAIVALSKQD